jgi:hypothetical protein
VKFDRDTIFVGAVIVAALVAIIWERVALGVIVGAVIVADAIKRAR